MAPPIKQVTFAGGEIAPFLYARTDNSIYEKSLRTLRNMMVMRHGGATGRPGTQYAGTTLNGGNAIRLIPFIFNETGLGQSYVLEFGNQYVAFYQDGANVVSSTKVITGVTQANPAVVTSATHGFSNGDIVLITGVVGMTQLNNNYYIVANSLTNSFSLKDLLGNDINSSAFTAYTSGGTANKIYIITSPYLQADLATLEFAESADIVTIVHPNYAPYELRRIAATNWTLTAITFGYSGTTINLGITLTGTAGAPDPRNVYLVTAVMSDGSESTSQVNLSAVGLAAQAILALASPTTPITISWGVTGFSSLLAYFKIYKTTAHFVGPGYILGALGYIGQTSSSFSFIDNGYTPDVNNVPPIDPAPFSGGNNPSTVGYIQQRRAFANTTSNPLGFWLSKPGLPANFNVHTISPQDDDAIIATVAGDEVNSIQHILELKFMLLLTAGAEIYVQGNGNGVVTPSAINASTQSQYGASPLRPLKVGDLMLFNQALGSFVRDFSFDFAIDGYRGNDITVFASHMFEGYQLSDWSYQKVPDSLIWAVRSDGVLLCCTYVREQQVLAWSRHDFQNGIVENVCSIPENGEYAVYLSIKRVINGATVRYIERMSSRIWSDPIDATYLDCFIGFDGRNTGSTTMTLTASGGFSTTDTAYQQQLTLTASAAYFGTGFTAQIGDQIFLEDAEWIASQGSEGNQIRLTIQAITNSTVCTVTPSGTVPAEFQAIAILLWARAVQTVSGLTYLANEEVSVWADRFVVGSPLNYHISTVYTVSSGGVLILDKQYSVIYVGLPMIQDMQTLDRETVAGESILASRRRTAKLAIYIQKARTFFAGSENPDTNLQNTNDVVLFQLYELMKGTSQLTYDQPPILATDQDFVLLEAQWNKNGRLFIRNVDPSPLTILAVSPGGDTKAPNPGYERV